MSAEYVHAFVKSTQRPLDAQSAQDGDEAAQRPAGAVREEHDPQDDRADDERTFDPEVRSDVVAADGEHEADRSEDERGDTAERALEQNDRGQIAEPAGM